MSALLLFSVRVSLVALTPALHHKLNILLRVFHTRFGTRVGSFKREPSFKSTGLGEGESFRPLDGHDSLRHRTPGMLVQQMSLLHQLVAILKVHLADARAQDFD